MGRLKVKGKAGAAKNFVTRSAAVKKLQCTLADFRRLCILKGIFPREPRSKKKANKGSSAPTSFYYAKDIAYLAHEPILRKLREHKAFAKKLSRALGRGEWSSAKSLEEQKPTYKLDHIIKERYPTFIDAVRDIDDALCMIFLFASLPSDNRLSAELISNCTRLAAEWQLYVLHTRALRKVFLSIKGVYYQVEVMDQTITWLVPYQFTSRVPSDVDVRVMLTFLELYQTLLSFVFFKLYTDAGFTYPPPLDASKDDEGAGIGALTLKDAAAAPLPVLKKVVSTGGKQVTGKDVRQVIKAIGVSSTATQDVTESLEQVDASAEPADEDFVDHPSSTEKSTLPLPLPTMHTLSSLPQTVHTKLFAPYTFFLSREVSRSIFEFIVRSAGGRIGWPSSSGAGSPFNESDPSITHVIIDRPTIADETPEQKELRARRKYVQPQWIVDCLNAGRVLLEEPYAQGKSLPPHLSPFGVDGAYVPEAGAPGDEEELAEEEAEEEQDETESTAMDLDVAEPAAVRAAEIAAEAAGMDYGEFEKQVKRASKKTTQETTTEAETESDMNKMMMSNRRRKLYEKVKHSQRKTEGERDKLEKRRKELRRAKERAT